MAPTQVDMAQQKLVQQCKCIVTATELPLSWKTAPLLSLAATAKCELPGQDEWLESWQW